MLERSPRAQEPDIGEQPVDSGPAGKSNPSRTERLAELPEAVDSTQMNERLVQGSAQETLSGRLWVNLG